MSFTACYTYSVFNPYFDYRANLGYTLYGLMLNYLLALFPIIYFSVKSYFYRKNKNILNYKRLMIDTFNFYLLYLITMSLFTGIAYFFLDFNLSLFLISFSIIMYFLYYKTNNVFIKISLRILALIPLYYVITDLEKIMLSLNMLIILLGISNFANSEYPVLSGLLLLGFIFVMFLILNILMYKTFSLRFNTPYSYMKSILTVLCLYIFIHTFLNIIFPFVSHLQYNDQEIKSLFFNNSLILNEKDTPSLNVNCKDKQTGWAPRYFNCFGPDSEYELDYFGKK